MSAFPWSSPSASPARPLTWLGNHTRPEGRRLKAPLLGWQRLLVATLKRSCVGPPSPTPASPTNTTCETRDTHSDGETSTGVDAGGGRREAEPLCVDRRAARGGMAGAPEAALCAASGAPANPPRAARPGGSGHVSRRDGGAAAGGERRAGPGPGAGSGPGLGAAGADVAALSGVPAVQAAAEVRGRGLQGRRAALAARPWPAGAPRGLPKGKPQLFTPPFVLFWFFNP